MSTTNNGNAKMGDTIGFNVRCVAANGIAVETYSIRSRVDDVGGEVMNAVRNVQDSYEGRGWTVWITPVVVTAAMWAPS